MRHDHLGSEHRLVCGDDVPFAAHGSSRCALRKAKFCYDAYRVECPTCGIYIISGVTMNELRQAWDRNTRDVLDRLPLLSRYVRGARNRRGSVPTGSALWKDGDEGAPMIWTLQGFIGCEVRQLGTASVASCEPSMTGGMLRDGTIRYS
jgi:hypothetical protein